MSDLATSDTTAGYAEVLDAADPLADFREKFIGSDDPTIIAYLDGNSLGRPLRATRDRISDLCRRHLGETADPCLG